MRFHRSGALLIGIAVAFAGVGSAIASVAHRTSCTASCHGVATVGYYSSTRVAHTVTAATALDGVACPASKTCVAVGYSGIQGYETTGVVVTLDLKGTELSTHTVKGIELTAVACLNTALCYAVSRNSPVIVPIVSGVPAQPITVIGTSGLDGVECSDGRCLAVGPGVVVAIASPGPDEAVPAPDKALPVTSAMLSGVGCVSAEFCVAVGNYEVLPISNGVPGTPHTVDASLDGIACRASGCTAVGTNAASYGVVVEVSSKGEPGHVNVWKNRVVTTLTGIACVSKYCAAVSSFNSAQIVPITAPATIARQCGPFGCGGSIHGEGKTASIRYSDSLNAVACTGGRTRAPCVAVGGTQMNASPITSGPPASGGTPAIAQAIGFRLGSD